MKSFKIKKIWARQILDSRGNPTVEVEVTLDNGVMGRAAVPSGASTGAFEAVELRDGNKKNYMGKSVEKAVENVNKIIAKKLKGMDVEAQAEIDNTMIALDGTPNKAVLGANAILGVSLAVARARANAKGVSLFKELGKGKGVTMPVPMMNILNGGKHADNSVNCQEFMIMPVGAKSWSEALKWCVEIFHNLKAVLKAEGFATSVGDEGGFAPNLKSDEDGLKYIVKAIEKAGYKPGTQVGIALDVAATEMFEEAKKAGKEGQYYFWKSGKFYTTKTLINYYKKLVEKYPIVSIEDGLAEEDWEGWKLLTNELGGKIQLVGDDLFVTNSTRLKAGIERKSCNAILIKPNQVGTLTETADTVALAKSAGFGTIISHRSGETEDTFIADLTVGLCAGQIKTGAPCRGERTAKYNRLLKIEKNM